MNSKDLDVIVEFISNTCSANMSQIIDSNYKFRFIGSRIANLLKIKDVNAMRNQCLTEGSSGIKKLASQYKLNNIIMNSKTNGKRYATYAKHNNNILILENTVLPIESQRIFLGVVIESKVIQTTSKINPEIIKSLENNDYKVESAHEIKKLKLELNIIEELIVFLISIGFGDKEIYSLLHLNDFKASAHAVSKIITRNIYPKFNVSTRQDLIKKSYTLGLNNQIPKILLSNQILLNKFLVMIQ